MPADGQAPSAPTSFQISEIYAALNEANLFVAIGIQLGLPRGRICVFENPGDAPLPPITDPDVIEPGEPNPARTPMRVRGAKRSPESFAASLSTFKAGTVTRNERSNLFSSTELEHS